jgi:hypothetical protein
VAAYSHLHSPLAAFDASEKIVQVLIDEEVDASYYTEAGELAVTASKVLLDKRDEAGWLAVVKFLHKHVLNLLRRHSKRLVREDTSQWYN